MEIKFKNGGLWGGLIPDAVRKNNVDLVTNNLIIKFEGEEFDNLRKEFDKFTQEKWEECQKIVEKNDKQHKIAHEINDLIEKMFMENTNYVKDEKINEFYDKFIDPLFNALGRYW